MGAELVDSAVGIVDSQTVVQVVCERSQRRLYCCSKKKPNTKSTMELSFADLHDSKYNVWWTDVMCSCAFWKDSVLVRGKAMMCPHQIAAFICQASMSFTIVSVESAQYASLLQPKCRSA
jgi:hypothetical protein